MPILMVNVVADTKSYAIVEWKGHVEVQPCSVNVR